MSVGKRRAPLRSSGPPERRTRVKPRNAKRKASEFARCYGSKERVAWIRSLPCIICELRSTPQVGPSDNAHVTGDGMGRKADARFIVPLCRMHHACYDIHRPPFHIGLVRKWAYNKSAEIDAMWSAHLHQQTGAGTT